MSVDAAARAPQNLRGGFGCITVPFLVLAAVPLLWGARNRWADGALLRNGVSAVGRVIELRREPGHASITRTGRQGRGGNGRSPVVEYRTTNGERRVAVGSINRDPPEYAVGDPAVVLYDPADPSRADVRTELVRWRFWFTIWTALGLLLAAIALTPFLVWWLQNRRGG